MTASRDTCAMGRERLRQAAARWFARSRSASFGRADQKALQAWLEADPDHRRAYADIVELWEAADEVRGSPEILALREGALRRYPAVARRREWRWLAAGAAAAAAAGALFFFAFAARPVAQVFQTGVGQTATIALIDGSRLTLDTDTRVRTVIGARRRDVHLERGRAFFKVAKDARRPFVVEAQGKSVTATGTAFEVTAEARRFEVLLVEGRVRVSQPAEAGPGRQAQVTTELRPGTRLIGVDGRRWTLARAEGDAELGWMRGELFFDNKPLGDIVGEMNRYSRRKIVIRDPGVASRTVYGAFMAGDVDQFVHALVDYRIARVVADTESTVVLAAP